MIKDCSINAIMIIAPSGRPIRNPVHKPRVIRKYIGVIFAFLIAPSGKFITLSHAQKSTERSAKIMTKQEHGALFHHRKIST